MQAIILAAGMGSRLKKLTGELPKCLVPVNGKPMLINTLELLESRGITEVVLVVGYLKDKVYEAVGDRFGKMSITYVTNDIYDKTNNIYSLWLAKDKLNKPTILLECDLFFGGDVIDKVLESRKECRVLVSKWEPFMSGTVVSVGRDGVIERLIPGSEQHSGFDFTDKYKTLNIYYFSDVFLKQYFVPNLDLYVKTQGTSSYYELVLGALIYIRNPKIHATIVDGLKWFEIDDEADLKRAEYSFAPPRKRLEMITPLHGGYWRYDFIDFCYLFNLYFPNESLMNELQSALNVVVRNYPSDMKTMATLMGRAMNLPAEDLVVGNGASELIRLINVNYVKRITIPIPTFNEYENMLAAEQINYFDTRRFDFNLDADAFVGSVRQSDSNVALIINPNNPTSLLRSEQTIRYIVDCLKDIDLLVIDESFFDFSGEKRENSSAEVLLESHPNLVLLRSISKEFGIPGLRLGYLASSNIDFVTAMRRYCTIWNINGLAEVFLELFPKYQDSYSESCKLVRRDCDDLYEALRAVPFLKPYKPRANFVFAQVDDNTMTSQQLKETLFLEHRILIKDCSNKTGLENGNYVRISARTPSDNQQLLDALANCCSSPSGRKS